MEQKTIYSALRKTLPVFLAILLFTGLLLSSYESVQAAGKKVALNVTHLSLSVGQSRKLSVSNAKNTTWTSSDKSVASISKKGTIKAKKAGKTTITATTSGKKLKCYVVVNDPSSTEKNVLITYFTHTGTTKEIAKKLQKLTGGDLLRIKERNKYTSDYDTLVDLAQDEIEQNARPKVTTEARNIDSYDVIYVGYPIWWGTTPRVVNTFLEKYDLSGKTIIPFCTSGGSDIEGSLDDLKASCKDAIFQTGYTADSGSTSEIRTWLTEIGELEKADTNTEGSGQKPDTADNPSSSDSGKLLVAYFSWSGTSERIAKDIIEQTGADSFRIERETPYSTDYNETAYGDAKDEADNNARPPIKDPLASIEEYDKIILCYPIWWHTAPMVVGTFLERYDFTGKTIYPVSQSTSMDRSQYNQSVTFIKDCARNATVDDGLFTTSTEQIHAYLADTVLK